MRRGRGIYSIGGRQVICCIGICRSGAASAAGRATAGGRACAGQTAVAAIAGIASCYRSGRTTRIGQRFRRSIPAGTTRAGISARITGDTVRATATRAAFATYRRRRIVQIGRRGVLVRDDARSGTPARA
jgi:hypothetical protein